MEALRPEMERAALARVEGIPNRTYVDDPEYLIGLRDAVSIAILYWIRGIPASEPLPVPQALLVRARQAARSGVDVGIVMRRYLAGHTLLDRYLIEAAEDLGAIRGVELARLLSRQATLLDHLFGAIGAVYAEVGSRRPGVDLHQAAQVRRLLAGELIDPADLGYELDAWHLAAVAHGPGAVTGLRDLATGLGARLLLVRDDERTAWAWFGRGRNIPVAEAIALVRSGWQQRTPLALGEPGEGLEGWRISHRQAVAAMSVARRQENKIACYGEVSLLASALRDELLADSLRDRLLTPLARARDGGTALRRTLSTYFAVGRNVSSTAAALGVSRQTVGVRLRAVEEQIGRPLDDCATELEVALRLLDLQHGDVPHG